MLTNTPLVFKVHICTGFTHILSGSNTTSAILGLITNYGTFGVEMKNTLNTLHSVFGDLDCNENIRYNIDVRDTFQYVT